MLACLVWHSRAGLGVGRLAGGSVACLSPAAAVGVAGFPWGGAAGALTALLSARGGSKRASSWPCSWRWPASKRCSLILMGIGSLAAGGVATEEVAVTVLRFSQSYPVT